MEKQNKNAVIYARYSSERQNEQSIEGQIRVISEYAEREGYTIVDTYIDRALSGRSDNRPSFLKMIKDSEGKNFQYVLVYKLDRFSRDRYDSAIYKRKLRDNGVKVISATEMISDSPEGVIMESILEGYSEYYSKELAQKIQRGNHESRLKGLYTGGPVIYGYRINQDRKYVIDENEAEVVRKIFRDVLDHKRIVDIVDELNSKNITYKDNAKWNQNNMARLLRTEKYTGIARFGDEVFDNIVPPIISEEDFNEVRNELMKHKHKNQAKRVNYKFYLSEKMVCGKCGARMYGHSGTSKTGKVYHYYKCNGAIKHTCDIKTFNKNYIEDLAIYLIFEYVLGPEVVEDAARRMVNYYNSISSEQDQINILEDTLKEVNKKLENLINAVSNGLNTATITNTIKSYEEDKAKIETDIMRLKSKSRLKVDFDYCLRFLYSLGTLDPTKERDREHIINSLIKKIILDGNRILLVFYPTPDLNFRNYDDETGGSFGDGENGGKVEYNFSSELKAAGSQTKASVPPNENRTLITLIS